MKKHNFFNRLFINAHNYPSRLLGWIVLVFIVLVFLMACSVNLNLNVNKDKGTNNNTTTTNDNDENNDLEQEDGESFHIKTPADLDLIRNNPAGVFYLDNDIDMTDIVFTPIPIFSGKLYGEGHTISNLKIDITEKHDWQQERHVGFISLAQNAYFEKLSIRTNIISNTTRNVPYYGSVSGLVAIDKDGTYSEIVVFFDVNIQENIPVGGMIGGIKHFSRTTIKNSRVDMMSASSRSGSRGGFIASGASSDNVVIENSYVYDIDGGLIDTGFLSSRAVFLGWSTGDKDLLIKNSFWFERPFGQPGKEKLRTYAIGNTPNLGEKYNNGGTTVKGFLLNDPFDFSVEPFASLDTTIWNISLDADYLPKLKWE